MPIPELVLGDAPVPEIDPILIPEAEPPMFLPEVQNAAEDSPETDTPVVHTYSLTATAEWKNLSPEEQSAAQEFAQKINLEDPSMVLQYGSAAQQKIAQFSDAVLKNVRTYNLGEVGQSLSTLVVEIKSFDATTEERGLFAKLGGLKKRMEKMTTGYNSVEKNINRIQGELEGHQRALMKDIHTLNILYDRNQEYFKELTMYIAAGMDRLDRFHAVEIAQQRERAEASSSQVEAQKLNDMLQLADRFEKKLHDLKLSRTISLQMAPQIRMLQNNDGVLVEKIQSSIVNSIPLWKNQMVLAMGLANSRAALQAQRQVTDMTNTLLQKNSEMLRQGTIEVAKEAERGVVSIETIKKSNENLIATLSEVMQIQEKGRQERAAAEGELARIEHELHQALLQNQRK